MKRLSSMVAAGVLSLSCPLASAAGAQEAREAQGGWTMLLMTSRFAEKLEFPNREGCTRAAMAMRQQGRIGRVMSYVEIFCIRDATGEIVGIDTKGNIWEAN